MTSDTSSESEWYRGLDHIDVDTAIKNSGSEEAFKSVLKIFYDSLPEKYSALEDCYSCEDWENYTIRIHALKSSARLVGAVELGEDAQLLETAGKENNIQYIRDNHATVMDEFLRFKDVLAPVFAGEKGDDNDKPVVDAALMADIYEGLREAAEAMDCDMVDDIMNEVNGYRIPDDEKEKFDKVRAKAEALDYDGMIALLSKE